MSQKAKTKAALKRRKEKSSRKESQRARYAAYRDAGQNGKRQKIVRRKKRRGIRIVRHWLGPCGNAGCQRCHPSPIRAGRKS
jgi:hypothetical protein